MTTPDLTGKRVLLLGAEADLGAEIACALAEAGASVALIAASNDPQTAFAVQRLARKLGAPVSQAIDATNEMAVRVMVRQVSKELGGLDGLVLCADLADIDANHRAQSLIHQFSRRELERGGGGTIIRVLAVGEALPGRITQNVGEAVADVPVVATGIVERYKPDEIGEKSPAEITAEVLAALAAPPASE